MIKKFALIIVALIVSVTSYAQFPVTYLQFSTVSPGAPANRQMWTDGTHLYIRLGGVSYQVDQQAASFSLSSGRIPYWNGSAFANGPYWDNSNTRLGIGASVPHGEIQLSNASGRKIILIEGADNNNQFGGFYIDGTNDRQQYQVPSLTWSHRFYAAVDASTSNELLRIGGDGVIMIPTTPTTDNTATPLSIDGSGNVTKKTDLIDGAGSSGRFVYWTDANTQSSSANGLYDPSTNEFIAGEVELDDANLNLGTSSTAGTSRLTSAVGSGSNINLEFAPKGGGGFLITGGNGVVANLTTGGVDFNMADDADLSRDDASTNTVLPVLSLYRRSTGTAAAGIGAGIDFYVETTASNDELGAGIEAVATDVTGSGEDVDLVFKTMFNGITANEKIRLTNLGFLGLATASPDRLLHPELSTTSTNLPLYPFRLTVTSTGTPAADFAVGQEFELETSPGNNEVVGTIEAVLTDPTSTSEDADFVLNLMRNGSTPVEKFRVSSDGSTEVQGLRTDIRNISASGNHTADLSDHSFFLNTTLGGQTIDLPTASSASGLIYVFKRITGGNTVTIDPNGAETVEGTATHVISTSTPVRIQSNGSAWYIIGN